MAQTALKNSLIVVSVNLLHLFVVAIICVLFMIVFVGVGAVLTFCLCIGLSFAASFLTLPREAYRVALILGGTVAIFFIVALWVLSNAPGGTYTSQVGTVITTWWENGVYTAEGTARVWRVVGAGMGVFLISEAVRSLTWYLCSSPPSGPKTDALS